MLWDTGSATDGSLSRRLVSMIAALGVELMCRNIGLRVCIK